MAIRAADTAELQRLSRICSGPDVDGNWQSLADYLAAASTAQAEPLPYVRLVDVLWEDARVRTPLAYSQDRRFRVTYTGRLRTRGGFSSQGYCVLDPSWEQALRPYEFLRIQVDYFAGTGRDLVVVRG